MKPGDRVKLSKSYLRSRCKSRGRIYDYEYAKRYAKSIGTVSSVMGETTYTVWDYTGSGRCWHEPGDLGDHMKPGDKVRVSQAWKREVCKSPSLRKEEWFPKLLDIGNSFGYVIIPYGHSTHHLDNGRVWVLWKAITIWPEYPDRLELMS